MGLPTPLHLVDIHPVTWPTPRPLPLSPAQAQNLVVGAQELGTDEQVKEGVPAVPSQGGRSSWPEGTLSWGSVAGGGPSPEGATGFCLTEACTHLLFLKLFLIQSRGLWVDGEQEVSCGERPCPEQGLEPGATLESRRLSLGLDSPESPGEHRPMCGGWRTGTWALTSALWLS